MAVDAHLNTLAGYTGEWHGIGAPRRRGYAFGGNTGVRNHAVGAGEKYLLGHAAQPQRIRNDLKQQADQKARENT